MKQIINLDPYFQPFGTGILFSKFLFPSKCEAHIKIPGMPFEDSIVITTRIRTSDDVMFLLLATDALRRTGIKHIDLFMPYLPYARQDRKMVYGEPLSLKVFSDLINAQKYSRVMVYDVHSDVSMALLENSESISNHKFVNEVLNHKRNYVIVSPDAGAYKKIFSLCQYLGYKGDIVLCNKIRDVSTGSIISIDVNNVELKNKDCYIVDDICDGGGTFTLLADELKKKGAKEVNLIVSHGILSKGIEALRGINQIYTTNSFGDHQPNERLTIHSLCSTLI